MRRKRDGTMSALGGVIDSYLRGKGMLRVSKECLIPIVWSDTVGPWYAKHTEVMRVEKGAVSVWCDSASRAQQLQLDSAYIIGLLNDRLGSRVVREIRPSSGGIRRTPAAADAAASLATAGPTPVVLSEMVLTEPETKWVTETASVIEDEDLREKVLGVLVKRCKLTRWQLEHGYRPCDGCDGLLPPGQRLCRSCDPGRVPAQGESETKLFSKWKNPWDW